MNKTKLCIPPKTLDQHMVMLGKTGAGKSSALRHLVEWLLEHDKRVCVIDPKGDWWGLKSGADGKSAGFPVIMFGDFKEQKASDVPINPQSGKHVAELIATGNRPCVIGFRGWSTTHMQQFWVDFAAALFARNAGELYIVGDEFHNFAPKGKVLSPLVGESLHWSNRLLSEGRGLGLVCLLASQRPQKVHNDTLTSCETLVAMRVIHKADRDAVKDWIDGNGDVEIGKRILGSLAGMPRGEAYVWSPEIGFGPEHVKFPMFHTFDSFAPPQLQKKVSGAGWADVNLDDVKTKLSQVIEEHKANDPRELRKQLVAAKAELAKTQRATPAAAPAPAKLRTVEKFVLKDGQLERAEKLLAQFDEKTAKLVQSFGDVFSKVSGAMDQVRQSLAKVGQSNGAAPQAQNIPHRPVLIPREAQTIPQKPKSIPNRSPAPPAADAIIADVSSRDALPGPLKKIIDAYAFWHSIGVTKPSRENVAPLAGYSNVRSSGFRNPLYSCSTAGLVADDALTDRGRELATWPEDVDTLDDYHAKLKKVMDGPVQKIFDELHKAGGSLSREDLASASGYTNPRSSGFRNPLYRLSSMGLVDFKKEEVNATALMYPSALLENSER